MSGQWFEKGRVLPDGAEIASLYVRGRNWQLFTTRRGGYALAVTEELCAQWIRRDLLEEGMLLEEDSCFVLSAPQGEMISSVEYGPFGQRDREANAFAAALKNGMDRTGASLADGIFIERFQVILPTFQDRGTSSADVIMGRWLCGGMNVALTDTERIRRYVPWLGDETRREVLELFGLKGGGEPGKDDSELAMPRPIDTTWQGTRGAAGDTAEPVSSQERRERKPGPFVLKGRKELEAFLREEILDVIDREEEYRRFGVGFPGATLLHGPSGSGKTFAVEQLADYLGWPVFRITSGTVGSKYIHETSRKISEIFDAAIREAPSVLIIDELESYMTSRDSLSGNVTAHMEEVGEFLRRIPEAAEHHVLLFGMTNMLNSIDQAILRRGRFDHIILVDMPSKEEVFSVLENSLSELPTEGNLHLDRIAGMLAGLPLSDTAFVVKEAGRQCVRSGRKGITYSDLLAAAGSVDRKPKKKRTIGFS